MKARFGIYHTEYARAPEAFFELVASDFVDTFLIEAAPESEAFAVSLDALRAHPDKQAWVAVSGLGFQTINERTIADTGETVSAFCPKTTMHADFRARINAFVDLLKSRGWYESVLGFYMDEPLLWNVTNDMLEEFTGYFRQVAAPDKRFFVCFSVAGVAPEFWTINDIRPITPRSVRHLTDIAFDMYHPWSKDYSDIFSLMLKRAGDRDDLAVWTIPCTMNYRGDKDEQHCLDHIAGCLELLRSVSAPGGMMCYTYHTFPPEVEALGNIGLDRMLLPENRPQWARLLERIRTLGRELIGGNA